MTEPPAVTTVSSTVAAAPPAVTGSVAYSDRTRDVLADLHQQHRELLGRLCVHRKHFASLSARSDAQAAVDRPLIATKVVDGEREVEALLPQIEAQQRALDEHAALHAAYCALAEEAQVRLTPLLDWLDQLDDEVRWATAVSRELDTQAARLLTATADRRFRRSACDPLLRLKESLNARLTFLQRYRVRHSGNHRRVLVTKKGT